MTGAQLVRYIFSAALIIGGIQTLRSFYKKDPKKALFTKELPVDGYYAKAHVIFTGVILIVFGLVMLLK
jgi:hypothetical protein